MNRWWIIAMAGVLAWHGPGTATALAQPPIGSYSPPPGLAQPPFSPFLNLNRSGTSPAINYFGLVRPQLDAANQLQMLQNQQTTLANNLGSGGVAAPAQAVPLSTTGHPVFYFDYARYFPLQGLGAGGAGGYGGAGLGRGGIAPGLGTGLGTGIGTGLGTGIAPGLGTGVTPGFGAILR